MDFTPEGAHAGQLGDREKRALADDLLRGTKDVRHYIRGVCYDAVAFGRYLLGDARITVRDLMSLDGQRWRDKFQFERAEFWRGEPQIRRGTAIGFWRLADKQVFHAALATGVGARLRGINGGLLGAGWTVEVDLPKVLKEGPNLEGLFEYDRTKIKVYLLKL